MTINDKLKTIDGLNVCTLITRTSETSVHVRHSSHCNHLFSTDYATRIAKRRLMAIWLNGLDVSIQFQ